MAAPCSMLSDRRDNAADDEHLIIMRRFRADIRIIALDLVAAVRVSPDPLHHADVGDRDRPDFVLLIDPLAPQVDDDDRPRSEEHTSELQSIMRISYAIFSLKN